MTTAHHRLKDLVELAKEPSSERRRDLLRRITDVFFEAPGDLTRKEIDEFSDIMGRVAFDLEMKVRQELAERLAGVAEAPHPLVARLANAEIEVARPLLQKSGVLRNADLLAIVRERSQGHLLAVSRRAKVSEEVSDALVEKGDEAVVESLAGNHGAELSRGAMETMVSRSEDYEALHAPLVTRRDLPPDLMHEMFWWVSTALRQYILSATADIDEEVIDAILDDTRSMLVKETCGKEKKWVQPRLFVREKELNDQLTPAFVVDLLRRKKSMECAAGFAILAGIDEPTAHRLIFHGDAEALAVACKAGGFDRPAFSNMMLLTAKRGAHKAGAKFELLHLYEEVTEKSAKRAVRFWQTRRQAQRPGPVLVGRRETPPVGVG